MLLWRASLVDFQARLNDPKQKISGGFFNHAEFVIAAPGQSLFSWCDVDRMAVVVVDELPYTLEIVEPKVPLVQSGSMNLKIRAHRKKGFTEPINVLDPLPTAGSQQRAGRRHSQGAERSPVSAQCQRRGRSEEVEDLRPRLGQRERERPTPRRNWQTSRSLRRICSSTCSGRRSSRDRQTELVCNVTVSQTFNGTGEGRHPGASAACRHAAARIEERHEGPGLQIEDGEGEPGWDAQAISFARR